MRWILLLAGLGLLGNGMYEWRRNATRGAGAEPRTCAELAVSGPGDTGKIRLTEFLLCTGEFAREEDVGRWTNVWIPAVARGGAYEKKVLADPPPGGRIPAPAHVQVLVHLRDVIGQESVDLVAEKSEITGDVARGVADLDAEARAVIAKTFPESDLDKCWIVEAAREPEGWGLIGGSLAGGVILLALALRMFRRKGGS
jgi:hypothetical protein